MIANRKRATIYMNSNSIFIMARDNHLLCRKANDREIYAWKMECLDNIPNIPFYYHLWDNSETNSKNLRAFLTGIVSDRWYAEIIKPKVFLALPDDAVLVDQRVLMEFLMQSSARQVISVKECMLLNTAVSNYVSVTKTCRMTALHYIKNGLIQGSRYLENQEYSVDEILSKIKYLHRDCEYKELPVFLNGDNLSRYKELGEVVSVETLLDNFMNWQQKNGA